MSNPFDRNPFRLPPPWNAGYALPQNVDDEGLERHAYTTAWAPRGSFDDPKVGTAGYAVPQYVKDEGYGVGAMTTRWAQRGSYAGPKVVHWLDKPPPRIVGATPMKGGAAQIKLQTMAGVEQSLGNDQIPLTNYGLSSAKALIDTVKMMPPGIRKKQLKLALDKIDPKLYARAEEDANKEAKLGVPADIALERGLAAAMAYGLAKELVDVSKGKPVGKKSQLGAACGLAMMGEDPVRAGFCWIAATASVPGHWERMRQGQTSCVGVQPSGVSAPVVRDQRGTTSGGGVTVTDAAGNVVKTTVRPPPPPPPAPADQLMMNIGPFLIPVNVGAYHDHRALTAEKKAYVDENIAIAAKAGGVSIAEMKTGKYPFVKFKAGANWRRVVGPLLPGERRHEEDLARHADPGRYGRLVSQDPGERGEPARQHHRRHRRRDQRRRREGRGRGLGRPEEDLEGHQVGDDEDRPLRRRRREVGREADLQARLDTRRRSGLAGRCDRCAQPVHRRRRGRCDGHEDAVRRLRRQARR